MGKLTKDRMKSIYAKYTVGTSLAAECITIYTTELNLTAFHLFNRVGRGTALEDPSASNLTK